MKKLYVGNLPFQATEEDVSGWFTQAGVAPANVTLVGRWFPGSHVALVSLKSPTMTKLTGLCNRSTDKISSAATLW